MSTPNRTFCSRHRPPRPEHALSKRNLAHVLWYRRERLKLVAALGGKCVDCGTRDELEFDELLPRPAGMPRPNRTSRWQRLRNYIKLHALGQICLRCRVCNARRGEPPPVTLPHGALEGDPF